MTSIISSIKSDRYQYTGRISFISLFESYFKIPCFRYMVWHCIANRGKYKGIFFYFFLWFILPRLKGKYGFDIPTGTNIDIGAKIIGNIKVGNNLAIGADAVMLDNIPDFGATVGIPAKRVSLNVSTSYLLNGNRL